MVNFTRLAFVLSYVSLVFTVIAFIAGLVLAFVTGSSATLGFALENAADFGSSVLVCWRFWGGGLTVPEETLELREKRASVGIAMSFVVLALVVGGVASGHLTTHEPPSDLGLLLGLSIPSVIIFGALGCLKMWVGIATRSASMKKDAACSLCGAILSLGVCIGAAAVGANEQLWWIDAVVALVVSIGLLLYGLYTCLIKAVNDGNKWWTKDFWRAPSAASDRAVSLVVGLPAGMSGPGYLAGDAHVPIDGEPARTSAHGRPNSMSNRIIEEQARV